MPYLKEIFDNPNKIRTWALYATSVLERGFGLKNNKEELDNLYQKLISKVIGDDQKYAVNYFYNYRKMELDMPYDETYISDIEANRTRKQIKEAAGGIFDPTSKVENKVRSIMNDLQNTLNYLQGNAFVKSYNEEALEKIIMSSDEAWDSLKVMMTTIDDTPDTKKKGSVGFKENINEDLTHPGETCKEAHPDMSHKKWESTQTNEDNIKFNEKEMDTLHNKGEIEKDGHTIKYKIKEDLKKAAQHYKDPNISEDIKSKLSEYIKQNYKKLNEMDLDQQMELERWFKGYNDEELLKKYHDLNNRKYELSFHAADLLVNIKKEVRRRKLELDEGTCGYGKDGKLGDEPAGPHLITKDDLKEIETDEVVYKIQQAKESGLLDPDAIEVIKSWIEHGGKESYPAIIDFINNLLPEEKVK
tara:strand:+ start:1163 stop:2410 length:1248 start_codon:yes stop_codon:yes gene_type:complete